MATKHFFNNPDGLVQRGIRGNIALNPALRFYAPDKVLYNSTHDPNKVAIIAGGGAGHEPGHAGVVGRGMLTVAVSGEIFASPSTAQICTGIDLANSDAGVVFVVNNYTGDCLNFGLAAEKARAARAFSGNKSSGDVEIVNVSDDVAVGRQRGGLVGRRGLGINIFTCKALGAASEMGMCAKEIANIGREIVAQTVTIGTSLDHCHVPGRPKKADEWGALAQDACEIGMGIHNEPGVKHLEKMPEPDALIMEMLNYMLNQGDKDRAYVEFNKDDAPIVFLNNLGGVSQLEMGALTDEVLTQLERDYGLYPSRVFAHTYMTSLNAPGFGISLVNQKQFKAKTGVDLLELIDAPTDASGWAGVQHGWGAASGKPRDRKAQEDEAAKAVEQARQKKSSVSAPVRNGAASEGLMNADPELVKKVIKGACEAAVAAEPELTKFDTIVGDGDCGETLASCANALSAGVDAGKVDLASPAGTCLSLGALIERNMGGTSGAIYALFFTGLVQGLAQVQGGKSSAPATQKDWGAALLVALENLGTHTPARPGMRTLVDALDPFCRAMGSGECLSNAVDAARKGAEETRTQTARLGRATYVGDKGGNMPPDPGAWGVAAIVGGIRKALGD
ncbi:putative DAK2-dihydroxyacetone kinase [Tilletiaria anomala UBC 951]|uniref:Putative DAK2-dihydroxyacetone kinase n=1 Tax=Tilletiaria anomala (strain ATCC 24038 / CBS 436.72 / UBC 951) TaxID=1037660 RepID=A0A066W7H8_TILAU|nr:putative DAK2-dihydroxyacetone kinase [Tilletiaria anomala UBC 951]KDN49892.1 putative DAK2-dihydroxyacetone kinase [Tilletiaria anomala UBC 951]